MRSSRGEALRILLLDTDRTSARVIAPEAEGCELQVSCSPADGLRRAAGERWDLILLDAEFSGHALDLLPRLSGATRPSVVLLSARPSLEVTLEAIGRGARDVLPKPMPPGRLQEILASLRSGVRTRPLRSESMDLDAVLGSSEQMIEVFSTVARVAGSDATVLLLGKSGTGKEMVARALHARSRRAKLPFVAINCAAIPENLLESELFGHEKGAFTGAIGRRMGRFERATGGTLFLDEIGDMSLALQSKILRALQEREVERVGGTNPVPIDVRVVAATNRDLSEAVREGSFREDLYYRLAVVVLRLPPLVQRGDDLVLLAEHFIAVYAREHGRIIRGVAEEVFERLGACEWPGNVRQLRNAMERAVVMSSGETLLPQHLPPEIMDGTSALATVGVPAGEPSKVEEPLCTLAEMERKTIERALRTTDNNLSLAAHRLGIHRNTLRRKLAEHRLRVV